MYRANDFIVTQTGDETGNYHRLAEAMRRGCKLRPMKASGCFERRDGAVCALGAVAVGNVRRRPKKNYTMSGVVRDFPELRDMGVHPLSRVPMDLRDVIIALNDETLCSREAIADWLCRLGGCKHQVIEPENKPSRTLRASMFHVAIASAMVLPSPPMCPQSHITA
jgi:hypothetical protein